MDRLHRLHRGKRLIEAYRISEGQVKGFELGLQWMREQAIEAGCFHTIAVPTDPHDPTSDQEEIDPFLSFPETASGFKVVEHAEKIVSETIRVHEARISKP